jgi:hypothetical protein
MAETSTVKDLESKLSLTITSLAELTKIVTDLILVLESEGTIQSASEPEKSGQKVMRRDLYT